MASSAPAKLASIPRGNNLSFKQLEQLWIQAGGNPSWAAIMAAVALAESKGDRMAHHVVPSGPNREDSRGPWQINVYAHPQYARTNLYDPLTNARAAVDVFNTSGPGAWSTYKDGSYKDNLAAARGHGGSEGVIHYVTIGGVRVPVGINVPNPFDAAGHAISRGAGAAGGAAEHAATSVAGDVAGSVGPIVVEGMAYLALTAAALILFGLGMKQLTGVSPQRVVAERVSAASEAGASQGEGIPF